MVYPTSKLQWIDVNSEESIIGEIQKLYSIYSHKAQEITKEISEINFEKNNDIVKIQDHYGYTDLIKLKKIKSNMPIWYSMEIDNNLLVIDNKIKIPVFDTSESTKGFHGEVIYPYKLKSIYSLTKKDIVKIRRNPINVKFNMPEFARIADVSQLNTTESTFYHGYVIITKSKFYTIENIYISSE